MAVLLASESWGCPPWEIAGGSPMTWFFRWVELQKQRAKKLEYEREDMG